MKIRIGIFVMMVAIIAAAGCSESTSPANSGYNMRIVSEMDNSPAEGINKSSTPEIAGFGIDSVKITSFSFLISRIMLFKVQGSDSGRVVVTEPAVFMVDSAGHSTTLAEDTIPDGEYSKMKVEIHRFTPNEASIYASNSTFADFTTPERYTMVIKGVVYKPGSTTYFTYKGRYTENLFVSFDPYLEVSDGTVSEVALSIKSRWFFHRNGIFLNPFDCDADFDFHDSFSSSLYCRWHKH